MSSGAIDETRRETGKSHRYLQQKYALSYRFTRKKDEYIFGELENGRGGFGRNLNSPERGSGRSGAGLHLKFYLGLCKRG